MQPWNAAIHSALFSPQIRTRSPMPTPRDSSSEAKRAAIGRSGRRWLRGGEFPGSGLRLFQRRRGGILQRGWRGGRAWRSRFIVAREWDAKEADDNSRFPGGNDRKKGKGKNKSKSGYWMVRSLVNSSLVAGAAPAG